MYLPPRDALYASIAAGTWPDISPFAKLPLDPALFDPGLHWWQFDLLAKVAALFRAGYRRVLLQLATGGGKTVIAQSALLSARLQGLRCQFLVHRKELIKQTSNRFTSASLDHSYVAADFAFDPAAGLLLSGVQTLVKRLDRILPPCFVILDEAHHAVAATFAEILERWPDAFILLLTATPARPDGRGLEEQADVMVCGPPVHWLIDNHYLSDFVLYAPDIPDFTGVRSTAGDYNASAAAAIMNKPRLVGNVVEHYLELASGMQGIVFAQNREHSRALADAFTAHGIPAMHVDGDTATGERDRFDDAFRAGDIRIGTNVDLFGEGYDVPNIGYLGDAARSKSRIKVAQRWGRPLRYVPGKTAIICDHAGNALPTHLGGQGHGLPDDDYDYSLEGGASRAAKEKDWTSITTCLDCFRIYASALSRCPNPACGSERRPEPRVVRQVEGKLTRVERDALKKAATNRRKEEERACTTFDEMISLGKARGHKFPKQWARRMCGFYRIPTNTAAPEIMDVEWDG